MSSWSSLEAPSLLKCAKKQHIPWLLFLFFLFAYLIQ